MVQFWFSFYHGLSDDSATKKFGVDFIHTLYQFSVGCPGRIGPARINCRRLFSMVGMSVLLGMAALTATWGEEMVSDQFDLKNPRLALESIRRKHQLPALGAAIVTDEGVQWVGTTGTRKRGDRTPVTDQDLWHISSCGKAMTATMIARLVEAGKLRFEQTLGETFPELDTKMSDSLKSIRLIDLLSHTSGLPANFNLLDYVNEKKTSRARRKVLREALETRLLSTPGEEYRYSNWGYTLAGHVAERATGNSWEALMRIEVFKPLKMSTAGFGGTGTPGKIDQPWPHNEAGRAMPTNGKMMDNLPVMGPAGTMHMSLADWGKFVSEHLKGHHGNSRYLSQASFQTLHTAGRPDGALGWTRVSRNWAGGAALYHNGDNTMNYSVVWAAPKKRFAVLVATNQSSADPAADEVASGLIDAWQAGNRPTPEKSERFPKLAPFTAVRWEHQPVVKIEGKWVHLVSIDDMDIQKIITHCQRAHGDRWQQRFAEDLVEVMAEMGREPATDVRLTIRSLGSRKTRVLKKVAMTEANRRLVKKEGADRAVSSR